MHIRSIARPALRLETERGQTDQPICRGSLCFHRPFTAADFPVLIGTPAAGGMVLEVSTLIAMLVYGLIVWTVERIIFVTFSRPRGPVTETTTTAQHTYV